MRRNARCCAELRDELRECCFTSDDAEGPEVRVDYFRSAQARPSGSLPAEILPTISKDFTLITAT